MPAKELDQRDTSGEPQGRASTVALTDTLKRESLGGGTVGCGRVPVSRS